MTRTEAIEALNKQICCYINTECEISCVKCKHNQSNDTLNAAMQIALADMIRMDEREHADGCEGCEFGGREKWIEPCKKCRRNAPDRWRANT